MVPYSILVSPSGALSQDFLLGKREVPWFFCGRPGPLEQFTRVGVEGDITSYIWKNSVTSHGGRR